MLLSDYLDIGESLEKIGVFDPMLDKDNAFFINIQRLKETTTSEFKDSIVVQLSRQKSKLFIMN